MILILRPVCLPSAFYARNDRVGDLVTAVGWGFSIVTKDGVLRHAPTSIISNRECNAKSTAGTRRHLPNLFQSSVLCIGTWRKKTWNIDFWIIET